jgi:phosphate transport system permease protein
MGGNRPRKIPTSRGPADILFRRIGSGVGLFTFALLGLIGLFLLIRAVPAFQLMGPHFFTGTEWSPDNIPRTFGIAAVLYWTVVIAVIALVIAVPLSIAAALFITEYSSRRYRRTLIAFVDLLAAVPSVIYGIWGFVFLAPLLEGPSKWISDNLNFIPLFQIDRVSYTGSAFDAGLVLAFMVVPICTSVMREVFSQAPPGEKEAALALGSSRWGMIRTVVLPFGRGGIVGGAMLGLGRALGETIAVALIVSPSVIINPHILQAGANSIAALIALQFGDASQKYGIPALMAAGVTLFGVTLIVNFFASLIVARSRSGKGIEI